MVDPKLRDVYVKLWDVYVETERERDALAARLDVADRANDVLKAQLAEAERLLREAADEIERLRTRKRPARA